jgi:ubiquinone/menaquinone biosynthesis C-methylase UbiE
MQDKDYININRTLWNKRTEHHVGSDFYDMKSFLAGKTSLKKIELALLGNISGKKILHLQCHFGQDTISLARMGASVTGVDLSDVSINKARELAKETNAGAEFICCDLYSLPLHLNKKFDLVFTSYGTIGWLPDLEAWAKIAVQFLKPGGEFIMVDFHPFLWMYDEHFNKIKYSYFNSGPIVETEVSTYADKAASIELQSVGWNHATSELLNNLIQAGLNITAYNEYDYSPYNCFNDLIEIETGKFQIAGLEKKLPMVYAITGRVLP